jgi:S-formylglutathione hydrolase FrmB
MRARLPSLAALALLPALTAPAAADAPARFEITASADALAEPYTGRVYLAFSTNRAELPRLAMHEWFNPPPVFAIDVANLQPGGTVVFEPADPAVLAHPASLADLPPGDYRVQAILRTNQDNPSAGRGAGNPVSMPVPVTVTAPGTLADAPVRLTIDRAIPEPVFNETDRVKLVEIPSPLLSAFHSRLVTVRAAVILPDGFDDRAPVPYPSIVWIGGFGSDHTDALGLASSPLASMPGGRDALWIVPDPSCFRGHSVFADSANNGPWGRMLVEELLPAVEARFRAAGPARRFVTGVSSGGWSSLWLQLRYPDAFAGCVSFVPDPVAREAFQTVNLFDEDANFYNDAAGNDRPIARDNGVVTLTAREFIARETVLGPGGQIHSFEAVWSPRLPNGEPRPLFDRASGAIDPATVEAWAEYDIAHLVRTGGFGDPAAFAGKVHVYAGGADNFYLELAIPFLEAAAEEAGADMQIRTIPGLPHTLTPEGVQTLMQAVQSTAPVPAEARP